MTKCKKHDWRRDASIGNAENPGVVDTGNGSLLTVERCSHCGREKQTTKSYCGRNWENKTVYLSP